MNNDMIVNNILSKYSELLKQKKFTKNNIKILINSLEFNLNLIFFFSKESSGMLNYLIKHSNKKNFNLFDYSKFYEDKIKFKKVKVKKSKIKSYILEKLGALLIKKIVIFSGGENVFNIVYDRISYYFFQYFLAEKNTDFDKKLFNDVLKAVDKKKISKLEIKLIQIILKKSFCRKKKILINRDQIFFGAPINFLLKKDFIKCCFFIKDITIIGLQHGNGGAFYKNSIYYNFEKKISKFYFDWFPVNKSGMITRFTKFANNYNDDRRIFLIGQSKTYLVDEYLSRSWSKINNFSLNNSYLEKLSNNLENVYLVEHKNTIKYPKKIKKINKTYNVEKLISDRDILIFHNITGTFLFYAIKFKLNFLILTNFDYKKNSDISETFKKFLFLLEKKSILFKTKNLKFFYKKLNQLKNNKFKNHPVIFKDIKKYTFTKI